MKKAIDNAYKQHKKSAFVYITSTLFIWVFGRASHNVYILSLFFASHVESLAFIGEKHIIKINKNNKIIIQKEQIWKK